MIQRTGAFWNDLRVAARSLLRAKGLAVAVIATLALGIGANAAMFSLLRGVLLRPLVNRGEEQLLYVRHTANTGHALFSVPEVDDFRARVKTLSAFGEFSTMGFTMSGLGEPRTVVGGIVNGSYFEVMGLRPVLGRLLDARDDGPNAAGAAVLTYRFWSTTLKSDPSVVGKTIRLNSFLDARPATIVGVLEPCVPYPQETEIIANVVTSAHHLTATMVTNRIHRMTELVGRLKPGVTLAAAGADLRAAYGAMKQEHPDAYDSKSDNSVTAVLLRDQLTSGARTMLLVLMAASVLVFVIACSNVANLVLARTVRREGEMGIRIALGAGTRDLRRTLLTESLLLCAGGAALGLLIASPLLAVLSRYISRYSIRALDLTVEPSMLLVGTGLALLAAVVLAYIPRLPEAGSNRGFVLSGGGARVTGAQRKLKVFAVVQIAASFVLVAAAGAAVKTLLSLEAAQTGFATLNVLQLDVPVVHDGKTPAQVIGAYREAIRRIRELPGVQNVAASASSPWRDAADIGTLRFAADGHVPLQGEEHHQAAIRIISPGFFATLGLPLIEGRDFTDADRQGAAQVAIVSESLVQKMFPNGNALGHYVSCIDPILKAVPLLSAEPVRIVGIVPDVDDVNLIPKPAMKVYRPVEQEQVLGPGHLFVHAISNPYALVKPITAILRGISVDQPVEHPATLSDVRAEVLSPERLNVIVSGVFALVALLIAVVGVAGVLAFSVSGRMREFGIRLAVGSQPRNLLMRVMAEGAAMAVAGLAVGFACGYWLAQLAAQLLGDLKMPGALPVASSAAVLLLAAVIASLAPAAKAARVDVIQVLRMD